MKSSVSRILASLSALVLLAFVFIVSTPGPVFSRAGGGHSYSSGSKSSSSSSSSRKSSSKSSGWKSSSSRHGRGSHSGTPLNADDAKTLFLVFFIGGCVIVLKIAISYMNNRGSPGIEWTAVQPMNQQPPKLRAQSPTDLANALKAMSVRDPKWNSDQFLERAQKGFSLVQASWSNQELSSAQGFLSDSVYERFTLQIQEQKGDGIRDHMEQLRILSARIVQAETGSRFDTLHVAIRASAVNYRVSLMNNVRMDGSTEAEEFEEVWSFLRRPGSRTLEKPGLIEGNCPSCGAPLEIVRAAKCKYCQAFLRSGEHDWVLAEITQACEWAPVESKARPGITQLMIADPGFSVQQIEDRVSVMFWRYYSAFRLGKVDPLQKHAHPDFIEKLQAQLAPKPDGSRKLYHTAAVGSVTVLGASITERASSAESFDRIPVEVRWSWIAIEKNAHGVVTYNALYPKNSAQVFVLIRKSGIKSDIGLALSSSCCKSCGAPEADTAGTVCQYCQTPLNEGTQDWILEQITDPRAPEVMSILNARPIEPAVIALPKSSAAAVSAPPDAGGGPPAPGWRSTSGPDIENRLHGSADALRWMAHVVFADRKVENAELEMLKQYARTYGVPQAKFNEIVQAAHAGKALPETAIPPEEIAGVYRELVRFALADGTISDVEMMMLQAFGRHGKLPSDEMARILEEEKSSRT